MTAFSKGLILCAAQVALVASLGAKLLIDRATLPRVWVKAEVFDPNLPVRGRYMSFRVSASLRGFEQVATYAPARLTVVDGRIVASPAGGSGVHIMDMRGPSSRLAEPVVFFLPEHAPDPARLAPGQELWIEVTVPQNSPPRPLRLGIKTGAVLTPLE